MKKSLIWRFAIIAFVILGWTYSLFPIKDRPFLDIFRQMAAPKLASYEKEMTAAEEEVVELAAELERVADKESAEYKELEQQQVLAQSRARENKWLVESFNQILADAEKMLADGEVKAPYRAVKLAAQGDPGRPAIPLHRYVEVPTIGRASNSLVLSRVRSVATGKLHLGLDLQGGTEFIIGFDPSKLREGQRAEDVCDQIVEIMRNRVDKMGVVEPEIKPMPPTSISLVVPSVSEDAKADVRSIIKQTANLTFHLVHKDNDALVARYEQDPAGFTLEPGYEIKVLTSEETDGSVREEKLVLGKRPERVKGRHVKQAFASFNEFGNYYVSLAFDTRGAAEFADLTTKNVDRRLAIVLDGKVYSAPNINEPITQGQAQITGNFGPEEAKRLAGVIESGNLPVSINIDSEFGTDPTLGKDSIKSGTLAALIGLAAVLVFMILYYRFAGVIAVLALLANILLVFGTLALSRATITLPGIAGIVLTIGMAVDANVLIFERIREEIINGKSIGNAIKAGYQRAFVTILDANLTTLITALILFRVGTGPIRGFAVTLSIGIVASMFTALFMSRAIFDLLIHKGWLKRLSMMSFLKNPQFDFLSLRPLAIGGSLVLILISLGWAGMRGKDVLSIDFSGGTAVTFRVQGEPVPDIGSVRSVIDDNSLGSSRIGYKYGTAAEGRLLEVVLAERSTNEETLDFEALAASLNASFDNATFEHVQTNSIGGLIGERFRSKAILAALLATVAIVIYISFRFEFAYGIASVVALLHDVIIAAGVFLLCGRQLSLPVVAALLTIMGYSLNDTIVVFDRIREDLALLKHKSYAQIINLSINQTLSRTLLTSLTTLLVVIVLFLFGGGAINDFALVMLVGIIVGTYSSIFVASTVIATWHKPTREERASTA